MITENFREKWEKGSPSFTFYSIDTACRILTAKEAEIFKIAFDKKHQHLSSGSLSRNFTGEDHMPENFEYAVTGKTLLYRRKIVDPSAHYPLTDDEALLIAAASQQQTQEFFENSRIGRLETLRKNYSDYLTDADREVLARQTLSIDCSEPAQQTERQIPTTNNHNYRECRISS